MANQELQQELQQRLVKLEALAAQILEEIAEIKRAVNTATAAHNRAEKEQEEATSIETYSDFKEAAVQILEELLPEANPEGMLIPTFRVRRAFWEKFGEDFASPRRFSCWMLQLVQDDILVFTDAKEGPEIGPVEKMESHIRGCGHRFYLQYRKMA